MSFNALQKINILQSNQNLFDSFIQHILSRNQLFFKKTNVSKAFALDQLTAAFISGFFDSSIGLDIDLIVSNIFFGKTFIYASTEDDSDVTMKIDDIPICQRGPELVKNFIKLMNAFDTMKTCNFLVNSKSANKCQFQVDPIDDEKDSSISAIIHLDPDLSYLKFSFCFSTDDDDSTLTFFCSNSLKLISLFGDDNNKLRSNLFGDFPDDRLQNETEEEFDNRCFYAILPGIKQVLTAITDWRVTCNTDFAMLSYTASECMLEMETPYKWIIKTDDNLFAASFTDRTLATNI